MTPHATRRAALLPALLVILAACASAAGPAPTASPEPATSAPAGTATAGSATVVAAPCGPPDAPAVDHPDWAMAAGSQPDIIPLVASSLVEAGPSRFLYSMVDAGQQVLAAEDVSTQVTFYALERDPEAPVATLQGTFLESLVGRGMYRAAMDFECAGEWGMELTATFPDGSIATQRTRFQVHPDGPTPDVGEPAPRSDSLTASSAEELRLISTDPDPDPAAFERSVAEVVTSGQPSIVLFATPAFCQTGTCGPTLEMVKGVVQDHRERLGFVNVEPYRLHMTENGLQPELSPEGQLQPVQAVLDYGLLVEPYLFVVDAAGNVFARFEGVVGEDELRDAIEDVLAVA